MHYHRRAIIAAGLLLAGVAGPATAQQMNAEEFYQRALKLKKKGAMAMFSAGEVKALVKEVKAAGALVKQTRLSTEADGKHGRYCPPKGAKRMGNEEFLNALGAIPTPARRTIDMTEATTRLMEKKFPCPADKR
ncbi:MAG: hypothetical protein ABIN72_05730 [Sphingomicrobium sp.]